MLNIPSELVKDIKNGHCIPFVGAGATTEGLNRRGKFVDHIKAQCKYPKKLEQKFPEIMQYYCDVNDSGNKNKLIHEIIDWIEECTRNDEYYRMATGFYREIARVPFFRHFITTNWDPFCERELNVLVPMVEDRDIPFWDDAKRQVLKIHGCVTKPQTIVATRKDYDKCINEKHKGALFTRLRDLMATRSFIFVGFSISDPDFKVIYDEMIQNLAEYRRGDWVIDPDPKPDAIEEWAKRGVRIINMSGIAFARELTEQLEKQKIIPSGEAIRRFIEQRKDIVKTHFETCEKQDTPGGMASSMYQDGILHEIDEIVSKSYLGATIEELKTQLGKYNDNLRRYHKRLDYYDRKQKHEEAVIAMVEIAYWNGRTETLHRFIYNNKRPIPSYFHPWRLEAASKPVRMM